MFFRLTSTAPAFFLLFLITSCHSYKATIEVTDQLSHDVLKVRPGWEQKSARGKKWIAPVVGMAVAGYYGHENSVTSLDGTTYSGGQSAFILGAAGLGAGWIINVILFSNKKKSQRGFNPSESDKWLRKYNRAFGGDHLLLSKHSDKTLTIGPKRNIEKIRLQLLDLKRALERQDPNLTLSDLKNWKSKLNNELFFMPERELDQVMTSITVSEHKIAARELLSKIPDIDRLDTTHESLIEIFDLQIRYYELYLAANLESRARFDAVVASNQDRIVRELIAQDRKKIDVIQNNLAGLSAINSFLPQLTNRYAQLADNSEVLIAYKAVELKVKAILEKHSKHLYSEIGKAESEKQLDDLRSKYLIGIGILRDPVISDLLKRTEARKNEIEDEQRRQRAAAMEIEKQRQKRREAELKMAETRAMQRNGFELNTAALDNEKLILDFFKGNSRNVPNENDNLMFSILIQKYMREYAKKCQTGLPPDKVMIYNRTCKTERVTKNGWGVETDRRCIEWEDRPSNLFTTKEMHGAVQLASKEDGSKQLKLYWDLLTGQNSIGDMFVVGAKGRSIQSDIVTLVKSNSCDNKALKRFEENLIRYAYGKSLLKLAEETD